MNNLSIGPSVSDSTLLSSSSNNSRKKFGKRLKKIKQTKVTDSFFYESNSSIFSWEIWFNLIKLIIYLYMEKYKLIILKAYVSVYQRINTLRWSSVKNKHCKKRVEEEVVIYVFIKIKIIPI